MKNIPVPRARNLRNAMPAVPRLPWLAGTRGMRKAAYTEILLLHAALLASEERLATDDDARPPAA